jgi:hypothetical protein
MNVTSFFLLKYVFEPGPEHSAVPHSISSIDWKAWISKRGIYTSMIVGICRV